MYNTTIPSQADLPSPGQLIRSTIIAIATAAALLIVIVLPAEYGVDPTGMGQALGFTEMGEIKQQLAQEAEADRQIDTAAQDARNRAIIEAAAAGVSLPATENMAAAAPAAEAKPSRKDQMRVTLKPGEGAEIKLVMQRGERANFVWTVAGGVVNVDLHGDGGGESVRYAKKRGISTDEGMITAAFDGNHGWFWRNRSDENVIVILDVQGQYSEIRRII
ncbi:MAG: transmembrane anchor protein [Altererythrobacter sp.]|nr:transmembrane anchor protein [Altererythrobacter sp.]